MPLTCRARVTHLDGKLLKLIEGVQIDHFYQVQGVEFIN